MNTKLEESLKTVLRAPSPTSLWQLRAELLRAGLPEGSPLWQILDGFHLFLVDLSARLSAHEFSKLATLLDVGAIGGVVLENAVGSIQAGENLVKRLLIGGASEFLMVLASRQYIKAFEVETNAVYQSAAWRLQRELWQLSLLSQPDLDTPSRLQAIETLLAPLMEDGVSGSSKAFLVTYLFQILLSAHLNVNLDSPSTKEQDREVFGDL